MYHKTKPNQYKSNQIAISDIFFTIQIYSLTLSFTLFYSLSLSLSVYLSLHIYIYIYYIITVLVFTKSFCGFVLNQVQYNMESAQYLG